MAVASSPGKKPTPCIAAALVKAKVELRKLVDTSGSHLAQQFGTACQEGTRLEHLSSFVVTAIAGTDKKASLEWQVDAALRRELEKNWLGRRVLCTDRHNWSTHGEDCVRFSRSVERRGVVP